MYINREHNKFPLARIYRARSFVHTNTQLKTIHGVSREQCSQNSLHSRVRTRAVHSNAIRYDLRRCEPSKERERFCVRACTCVHRIDNNITHPMLIHHSHMAHTARIRFSSHLLFYFRVASSFMECLSYTERNSVGPLRCVVEQTNERTNDRARRRREKISHINNSQEQLYMMAKRALSPAQQQQQQQPLPKMGQRKNRQNKLRKPIARGNASAQRRRQRERAASHNLTTPYRIWNTWTRIHQNNYTQYVHAIQIK